MKRMASIALILLPLLFTGCVEPPKTAGINLIVQGLAHLYTWHPREQAKGQAAFDAVINSGPDVIPVLIAHITDETPTALYDPKSRRAPVIGDVCFLMLLRLTETSWETFIDDGVFIHSVIPNPIYSIKWSNSSSRNRVQAHFLEITSDEEPSE